MTGLQLHKFQNTIIPFSSYFSRAIEVPSKPQSCKASKIFLGDPLRSIALVPASQKFPFYFSTHTGTNQHRLLLDILCLFEAYFRSGIFAPLWTSPMFLLLMWKKGHEPDWTLLNAFHALKDIPRASEYRHLLCVYSTSALDMAPALL